MEENSYICKQNDTHIVIVINNLSNKINIEAMNVEVIGNNAGLVWQALSTADAIGVKQIKKMTKLKDKEVFAALGWLAREGKVNLDTDPEDEKEIIVSLVQG